MRRTGTRAQATKRYNKRRAKGATPTFKKKVLSVVNKIAEKKQFNTTISNTLGVPNATLTTWNLLVGLNQGTNTAQRVGDKIYIKNIRLATELFNSASSTADSTVNWRVMLFRGKYDYSTTSYPIGEVLENNAGSAAFHPPNAPMDLNQVSPLFDRNILLTNNYAGQKVRKNMTLTIPVNKTFYFRDDDNFGKVSNLYLAVYQANQSSVSCDIFGNMTIRYTDL